MKKIVLILLLFIAFSCEKEEIITAELGQYKRSYDVNSSDPVLKYVSIYNQNTGKHLIVDPDSTDYLFNFDVKNQMGGIALQNDQAYILKSIKLTEDIFLGGYSAEAQKKVMPYSIMLFDKLTSYEGWMPEDVTHYISKSIIAINVKMIEALPKTGSKSWVSVSTKMQIDYFTKFILVYNKYLNLKPFYALNNKYGDKAPAELTQEDIYKLGFVKLSGYGSNKTFPTQKDYAIQWFEFLLKNSDADKEVITSKYPKMKQNMEAMDQCLKKSIGVDYRKLVYVAK